MCYHNIPNKIPGGILSSTFKERKMSTGTALFKRAFCSDTTEDSMLQKDWCNGDKISESLFCFEIFYNMRHANLTNILL